MHLKTPLFLSRCFARAKWVLAVGRGIAGADAARGRMLMAPDAASAFGRAPRQPSRLGLIATLDEAARAHFRK